MGEGKVVVGGRVLVMGVQCGGDPAAGNERLGVVVFAGSLWVKAERRL